MIAMVAPATAISTFTHQFPVTKVTATGIDAESTNSTLFKFLNHR
jgi:hypothetical protein